MSEDIRKSCDFVVTKDVNRRASLVVMTSIALSPRTSLSRWLIAENMMNHFDNGNGRTASIVEISLIEPDEEYCLEVTRNVHALFNIWIDPEPEVLLRSIKFFSRLAVREICAVTNGFNEGFYFPKDSEDLRGMAKELEVFLTKNSGTRQKAAGYIKVRAENVRKYSKTLQRDAQCVYSIYEGVLEKLAEN